MEVDASQTSTILPDLFSKTLYNIELAAVYDEGESLPTAAEATTCESSLLINGFLWILIQIIYKCVSYLYSYHKNV